MRSIRVAASLIILATGLAMFLVAFHWTVNRIYVPEGSSLRLRYKGPLLLGARRPAQPGHFAEEGEVGVLRDLRGPGRHFFCPIWWERRLVPDVVVRPGEVAIVTSKLGDALPRGQFLVDGDLGATTHKGILRKVLPPGRYRINDYGYQVEILKRQVEQVGDQQRASGWVEVPTGFVGVVTMLADNPLARRATGIQPDVLPPGIYPINPREQHVDIVEIGFREKSISVDKRLDGSGNPISDPSGEPLPAKDSGISFPSNDGFTIQIDFTAIWGVMPDQAPMVVKNFGGVAAAEQKVILPQSESICRNHGSQMGAVELLIGETRLQFQTDVSEEFQAVLKDKNLELLYGLVRHIYIPQDIRTDIQLGYVADELKLTREQEKLTATTEALLREAERKVELETERIRTESLKMVASTQAEGEREAKEIEADTKKQVATIDRQIAELDAQREIILGEAEASAEQLQQEAKAQKFQLAVEAFGSSTAYNRWQFAESLPETIDLRLFYAGEGTLWTDLKGILPTLPLVPPSSVPASKTTAK